METPDRSAGIARYWQGKTWPVQATLRIGRGSFMETTLPMVLVPTAEGGISPRSQTEGLGAQTE